MKVEEVNACSLPVWYKKFKRSTIHSTILEIPKEVVQYLKDGGTVVLPEGSIATSQQYYNCDHEELHEDWKIETQMQSDGIQVPEFDEFSNQIKLAIKEMGGSVFPKLNWSSPKDATWVALNNSLKCKFPGDIFLLFKSSDFITHDLTQPYKDCDDGGNIELPKYHLVLRQWREINPSNEFRCFVKNKKLIGITQRDPSQHYKCLQNELKTIKTDIIRFWKDNILNLFPLTSYVFDVYRPTRQNVILIDFGPFGVTTDSLLFTWDELINGITNNESHPNIFSDNQNILESHIDNLSIQDSNRIQEDSKILEENCNPIFRCVTDETGVQPSPYMQYGLPLDIVDLTTGQDPYKLIDFLQLNKTAQDNEQSSDEESN